MKKKKIIAFIQTRPGFLALLVFCFWVKYIFAAYFDFNLGLTDPYQYRFLFSKTNRVIHCNAGDGFCQYCIIICQHHLLPAIHGFPNHQNNDQCWQSITGIR